MAFDDETIRIQVDGAQAQAQLNALEKEVRDLEAELKTLNSTAGVTNAEIEGTTRRLGEAKAAFKEASGAVKENNEAQEEGGEKTKSLADKYVTLGLKVFGARQVLMAAGEAMRSVAQATDSYSGATKDAIDQTENLLQSIASLDLIGASKALGQLAGQTVAWAQGLNEVNTELGNLADQNAANEFRKILAAQGALVQGHKEEVEALELKTAALLREIETQKAAGEVQRFVLIAIEEQMEAYTKIGEVVPPVLAEQADALGVLTDAQEKAAKSAEKLEEIAVKAAEKRAKAEAKAAEEIVAALEKERIALDAKLAQDQARLSAALAKGSPLDTSGESDEARAQLNDLKQSIKDVENQPLISVDQLNSLNEMKDRAGRLTTAVNAMSKVFTVTRDDFLDDEQAARAAAAAWDVYGDMLDQAQNRHNAAMDSIDGTSGALDDLSGTADDASDSLTDVADAAGSLGDKAKEGTDKAAENLAKMNEGLKESIPLANELKGILAEIVALGAQADI